VADYSKIIKNELFSNGADLVGIGSLAELPADVRRALPVGVCVAVKLPKEIVRGIAALPTKEYYDQYYIINKKLDSLVTLGAGLLKSYGFEAVAQTQDYVRQGQTGNKSLLPHKTVATRAGMGWIGKSALLVTKEFGSMVRISSLLTDAPLEPAQPLDQALCGSCTICTDACPGAAVLGKQWSVGVSREELFDAAACQKTAKERALRGFGIETTLCGKCIEVCPYTKRYLNQK
jgi:epoxyqueuosine reductase QueG